MSASQSSVDGDVPEECSEHSETIANVEVPDESNSGVEFVDTPLANHVSENLEIECSEEIEAALALRFDAIHAAVVSEKRNYDYLVNRLDKRFSSLEGQKNKAQNQTGELIYSVKNLLRMVTDIENNLVTDSSSSRYLDTKGVRGPPLPSQSDMFMLAYEKGQVSTSYSKFNQRQWSAQKSSYPRKQ